MEDKIDIWVWADFYLSAPNFIKSKIITHSESEAEITVMQK